MFRSDKREIFKPLPLLSLHNCNINSMKYSYDSTSKSDEESTESYDAIIPKIIYNFGSKMATLSFDFNFFYDFVINSLDLAYDFGNFKFTQDMIECIKDSREYKFSTAVIPRHIFYPEFSGIVAYKLKDCPGIFKLKFQFDIPYFQISTPISLAKFEGYEIPEILENLFPNEERLINYVNSQYFDREGKLSHAVYIEDIASQKEMISNNKLLNVYLSIVRHDPSKNLIFYRFEVSEKSKKFLPQNVLESSLQFIPMVSRLEYTGIQKIRKNFLVEDMYEDDEEITWIEFSTFEQFKILLDTSMRYEVHFLPNNIAYQASVKALKNIEEKSLKQFFANFNVMPPHKEILKLYYDHFEWFNKNIASNEEQKLAIKNIVNCTSFPFPYCIFGPPGTGKTSCLVECVLQILELKPKSKILLTAQSNSACNEIGERLLNFLPIEKLFRLYTSRLQVSNPSALNQKLLPSSNLRGKKNAFPTMEELKHFPVVISTLVSCSQLDRASLQNHFDYIFIDECAATTEPETCIPIVELGCGKDGVTATIVLIGDPKQLPPVITSSAACKLGLNVSLMERVMETPKYCPNPEYETNNIIQLCDNYRSHPSILHFSNVEFYESKLRAKNKSDEVYSGTKWMILPNPKFPVLFCNEDCLSEFDGKSSYNDGEIKVVQKYVNELLKHGMGNKKISPEDIGVVTPYKAQSEMLKRLLPEGVEIGTSEYFQGREKLIMIMSTVKSGGGIGFVADPRRLNVCLTRAKALLIVVGNAETLKKNPLWHRFIIYCTENNSFITSNFVLTGVSFTQPGHSERDKKEPKKTQPKNTDTTQGMHMSGAFRTVGRSNLGHISSLEELFEKLNIKR